MINFAAPSHWTASSSFWWPIVAIYAVNHEDWLSCDRTTTNRYNNNKYLLGFSFENQIKSIVVATQKLKSGGSTSCDRIAINPKKWRFAIALRLISICGWRCFADRSFLLANDRFFFVLLSLHKNDLVVFKIINSITTLLKKGSKR